MKFEDYIIPKPKIISFFEDKDPFNLESNINITTNCTSKRFIEHLNYFSKYLSNLSLNTEIHLDKENLDLLEKSIIYPIGLNSEEHPLYLNFQNKEQNIHGYKLKIPTWINKWSKNDYRSTDEYHIRVNTSISIVSRSERGLFYGLQTLIKLIHFDGKDVNQCEIHDYPSLSLRAIHVDLKFNCPNIGFLELLTKVSSQMKINTFIIEWEDKFPFVGDLEIIRHKAALSIEEKDKFLNFCFKNYIEAIPLIQSLGHFDYVLKHEKFQNLSEMHEITCTSERDKRMKYYMFCPLNENSKILIEKIHSQIINGMGKHRDSKFVHVGMDETYYLGYCSKCNSKVEENPDLGKSKLYIEHLNWIAKIHSKEGKFSIVWDDMLVKHPELIDNLDEHIIINDWDYSSPIPQGQSISKRISSMDTTGVSTNFVHTWTPKTLEQIEKDPPNNYDTFKDYWIIENQKFGLRSFPFHTIFREKGFKVLAGPAVQSGIHAPFSPNFPIVSKNIIYSNHFAVENKIMGSLCTNWVVREGLWPIMIYGFSIHGETSWNGEIIDEGVFTPKFFLNLFFNSVKTSPWEMITELSRLFYVLGLVAVDYDIFFNEMTTPFQRFSSKFDKDEYLKYIPEKIKQYSEKLSGLGKFIEKNTEIFNTISLNADYILFSHKLVLSLGEIEDIAEKLDSEEEVSLNTEDIENYKDNLKNLEHDLTKFSQNLTQSIKWHLKSEEFDHNYKTRIEPIGNHIKIIKNALNNFKEGIENFVDIIMELKVKRFS